MTKAAKHDDQKPEDKIDLFIAEFQHEYSEAISTAREAAETTSTPAWQGNYRTNIDTHRKAIKHALESIESTCAHIEASDTYESAEKEIAKAVKLLADERVRFGAWRSRAVQPYETAAHKCQEIISAATRRAADDQRDNPLLNIDLTLGVHARLESWPRAEWDDETGVVAIVESAK